MAQNSAKSSEVVLMQIEFIHTTLRVFNKPLLNVCSFNNRIIVYLQILGLIAISVPVLHFYMSVELTVGELGLHTASLLIAGVIVIIIFELTITAFMRTSRWRYSMTVGMFIINMIVGYVLVIGIIGTARLLIPEIQLILDKHSHAGYSLMPIKSVPVLLLMVYIIVQTSYKDVLAQRLYQQTKINQQLTEHQNRVTPELPLQTLDGVPNSNSPIAILSNKRKVLIRPREIIRIQADENYCHYWTSSMTHFAPNHYIVRTTLKDCASQLPNSEFIQTHRSHIVNLGYVREIKRQGRNFCLKMEDGDCVPVSRTRLDDVIQQLRLFGTE